MSINFLAIMEDFVIKITFCRHVSLRKRLPSGAMLPPILIAANRKVRPNFACDTFGQPAPSGPQTKEKPCKAPLRSIYYS